MAHQPKKTQVSSPKAHNLFLMMSNTGGNSITGCVTEQEAQGRIRQTKGMQSSQEQ
jgi:hypothetical protein